MLVFQATIGTCLRLRCEFAPLFAFALRVLLWQTHILSRCLLLYGTN